MRRILTLAVAAFLLAGCGSSSDPDPAPRSQSPESGLSADVKAAVLAADRAKTIRDGCDPQRKTWECYWDSFDDDGAGRLAVYLKLPASMDDTERTRLAAESGFTLFTIIGPNVPELQNVSFRDQHGLEIGQSDRDGPFVVQ